MSNLKKQKIPNIPNIPAKIIDYHTKICKECEERRFFMQRLYNMEMDSERNANEINARDEMLDNLFTECRWCFIKTNDLFTT